MVSHSARDGFTLLEVVVSLSLICTVLFGVTAASAWAARTLTAAEALENALVQEEAVLDSVLRDPAPVSGRAQHGRVTVVWSTQRIGGNSLISANVQFFDGALHRSVRIPDAAAFRALPTIGSDR